MASLAVAILAVQPLRFGWRTGNLIALPEPFQQVAILATAAAEGSMVLRRRLAAQRAGLGAFGISAGHGE